MGLPTFDSRSSARRKSRLEAALHRRWVRLCHRGDDVQCPCCGARWAAFAGDWNRADAICPGCGSHERHRGLWVWLAGRLVAGVGRTELLHFAPEGSLEGHLRADASVAYTSADLEADGVDVAADITQLPFPDESFDVILCSHVLEHVVDDRVAMSELLRVLRPGGWAAVMVPIDETREETYEDTAVVTAVDREREFWQHDHVRLYAPDIADRLRGVGLDVEALRLGDALGSDAVARHGLLADETIFCATRPR